MLLQHIKRLRKTLSGGLHKDFEDFGENSTFQYGLESINHKPYHQRLHVHIYIL